MSPVRERARTGRPGAGHAHAEPTADRLSAKARELARRRDRGPRQESPSTLEAPGAETLADSSRPSSVLHRYGPAFALAVIGLGLVVSLAFSLEASRQSELSVMYVAILVPVLLVVVSVLTDRRVRAGPSAPSSEAPTTDDGPVERARPRDVGAAFEADSDSDIDDVLQRRLAARRALPESLAGLHVGASSQERRCGYCHDDDPGEELEECVYCGVTLHSECLDEHGRCPTPGCLRAHEWRPASMIHAPIPELEQPRSEFEHVVGLNYRANRFVLSLLTGLGLGLGYCLQVIKSGIEPAFFALGVMSLMGIALLEIWQRTDQKD